MNMSDHDSMFKSGTFAPTVKQLLYLRSLKSDKEKVVLGTIREPFSTEENNILILWRYADINKNHHRFIALVDDEGDPMTYEEGCWGSSTFNAYLPYFVKE